MGVVGKCDNVSIVLSARDGRDLDDCRARVVLCPAPPSSVLFPCGGDGIDAPLLDTFERLGARCLDEVACEIHCDDGRFFRPGSFDDVSWFWGESCSVRVAIVGSRRSREKPLGFDALGSFGRALGAGRLEICCGRGRVLAVEELETEWLAFVAARGAVFVVLLEPNLGPVFRCSVDAEGRSRVVLAPVGPVAPARSVLGCNGRGTVVRGAGKRDIGRGRPLDFPAGAVLSSMAASRSLVERVICQRRRDLLGA